MSTDAASMLLEKTQPTKEYVQDQLVLNEQWHVTCHATHNRNAFGDLQVKLGLLKANNAKNCVDLL